MLKLKKVYMAAKKFKTSTIVISCIAAFLVVLTGFFVYTVYSSSPQHKMSNGVLTIKELGISLPIAGYDDIYYTHDVNGYKKVYLNSDLLDKKLSKYSHHSSGSDDPCMKNPLGTISKVVGNSSLPTQPSQAFQGSYNIAKQFDGFAIEYTNSNSSGPTACSEESAQLQKNQIEAIVNAIPNTSLISN